MRSEDWIATGPTDRRVELWTARRTPFTTDQNSAQKAMVLELEPRLRSLRCGPGERLHGVFTSDEVSTRQPDAENIAFYNFGSRPFAGAGRTIGFERSYAAAPPSATGARFHHCWSVVADTAPFVHWREGETVAEWRDVPIDLGGALGLSAWRAIREHQERVAVSGRLTAEDTFAVLVTVTGRLPSLVEAVKGLVDGPLAGLQRADRLDPAVVARLLGRRWAKPIDEARLLQLVSAHEPPPVLPRAPFNRNGLDPCDELCVAGIVRTEEGAPAFSGRVVRVSAV